MSGYFSESTIRQTARSFSIIAATAVGIIGAAAYASTFPATSLFWLICVGLGGFATELTVYLDDVQEALVSIVQFDVIKNLRAAIINRHLAIVKQTLDKFETEQHQIAYYNEVVAKNMILNRLAGREQQVQSQHQVLDNAVGTHLSSINKAVKKRYSFTSTLNKAEITLLGQLHQAEKEIEDNPTQVNKLLGESNTHIEQLIKAELRQKTLLTYVALFYAAAVGIGFGCMTFTHALPTVIYLLGFVTTSSTALAVLPLMTTSIFAGFAAITFGLLMLQTLSEAILKSIFRQIYVSLLDSFKPSQPWSELNWKQQFMHVVPACLMGLAFIGVLSIALLMAVAQGSEWILATSSTLGLLLPSYALLISTGLIVLTYMPVMFLFTLKHGWNAMKYLKKGFINLTDIASSRNFLSQTFTRFQRVSATERCHIILNVIGYSVGFVVALAAMFFHYIGEAAVAGEGIEGSAETFAKVFQAISKGINNSFGIVISAKILAASCTFIAEAITDTPFFIYNRLNKCNQQTASKSPAATAGHDHDAGVIDAVQSVTLWLLTPIFHVTRWLDPQSASLTIRLDQPLPVPKIDSAHPTVETIDVRDDGYCANDDEDLGFYEPPRP